MPCVCLLVYLNPERHICLHGRGKIISPTLIRDQPLQMNPNKNYCEGNLKTSLKSNHQYHPHGSGNRISTRKTLVPAYKNEPSRRKAKTNTPTLSTRHWGTDYEAVHKTNHVPRTDNHSETTLRTFQLWSPRQGYFVVFTQPCLILALFINLASCFHFAFLCSLCYVHFFICIFFILCFLIF